MHKGRAFYLETIIVIVYSTAVGCTICLQDNEWRRVIGFLTGVVDTKLSRDEIEAFSQSLDAKLRCFARRLTSLQRKLEGEAATEPAAGTKKAKCISCDRVVRYERE